MVVFVIFIAFRYDRDENCIYKTISYHHNCQADLHGFKNICFEVESSLTRAGVKVKSEVKGSSGDMFKIKAVV